MLPKDLPYRDRFKMALDAGFEGIEIGTVKRPQGGRRDRGRRGEDGPGGPLRHERRPLAIPALERRPRRGHEERRGHGDLAAQREAVGRGGRAARAGGGQPADLVPRRLDAVAEGHQGAHPAPGPGAEGGGRDRGGVEQVPAEPARVRALRGRVRLALGQGLPRRGQHGLLRLPAGLDPHPRAADRPRASQGLPGRPREGHVHLEEPRRGRHRLARGAEGLLRRRVRRLGHDRGRRRRRGLPEGRSRARRPLPGRPEAVPPSPEPERGS